MRKTKTLKSEMDKITARLSEIQKLAEEAKLEETHKIEGMKVSINEICETENVFCGIILTPEDVISIVQLAIISKENVKIPYNLYFDDK